MVTDAIVTSAFGGGQLAGAIDVARVAGYLLLVLDTHSDEERSDPAFDLLRARQVDGLRFAAKDMRAYRAPAPMRELPAVMTNSFDPDNAATGICCDEEAGGRAAAQLVLDHGHRDIAMISGTGGEIATQLRRRGPPRSARHGRTPARSFRAGWMDDPRRVPGGA